MLKFVTVILLIPEKADLSELYKSPFPMHMKNQILQSWPTFDRRDKEIGMYTDGTLVNVACYKLASTHDKSCQKNLN